jgi:hypothetical protein
MTSHKSNADLIEAVKVKDLDDKNNFKFIRFLIISGLKLKLSDICLATASMIFHKVYKHLKSSNFDPYLICTASIFLACKIEEEEGCKLRDIINVCYRGLHPDLEPLEINDKYVALRLSVVHTELFITRVLSFEFDFEHPHKFLLQYLDSLRHWLPTKTESVVPLSETSWHILRDLLHSDLFLRHRPQDIAVSIIYFVATCYGIHIPYSDLAENCWWKALNDKSTLSGINEICQEIMDIYETEESFKDF